MNQPLTSAQLSTLKTALRGRFEELLEEVRQDLVKADDDRAALLSDRVRDLEDESLMDLIADIELADIDRDLEELQDVEAALGRIRGGSYAVCIKCDGPIPFERLRAYPTAKRCRRCQALYEKTYAHQPSPSL